MILFFFDNNIQILFQNIQGISNKTPLLQQLLQESRLEVLCLSETFLTENKQSYIQIDGYRMAASYCRKNRKRGGVAILVKENLEVEERKDISNLSVEFIIEYCSIEIKCLNLLIICIYRSDREMEVFQESFIKLLNKLKSESRKNIIIGGDFNINILENTRKSTDFKNLLLTYNFVQQVKKPTRICVTTATCIDLIFTNFSWTHTEIQDYGLSDHHGVIVKIGTEQLFTVRKTQIVFKRLFSGSHIDKFKKELREINWDKLFNKSQCINKNYEIYNKKIQELLNLCFPKTKFKLKSRLNNSIPNWLTKGLKISCKHKRMLRVLINHTNNPIIKKYYRSYRRILKKSIVTAKKYTYIHQMLKSENKTRTMWNIIKQKTNKVPKMTYTNIKLKVNNEILEAPTRVADTFNSFFASVGEPYQSSSDRLPKINKNVENSMFLQPTNPKEIKDLLTNLKMKHSSGVDELPPMLLKKCADELTLPLVYLINQSFNEGTFPDLLKVSIIKPIHKKGNKTCPSQYRPIALLPAISKVFERAMTNRLNSFLEKYKILGDHQYGFRKNRSTILAVYNYVQQVLNYLNDKKYAVGILLDMTKAYDRVQHEILLSKLYDYGIRGKAHEWIKSYLKDRKQYVQITHQNSLTGEVKDYRSEPIIVNNSIPQGSVIGCVLFLTYINDLPNIINTPTVLFADDVSLLFKFDNLQRFQVEAKQIFKKINEWLDTHNLLINYSKTSLLEFRPHQKSPLNVELEIDNTYIEKTNSCSLLGLEIDSHLSWKPHVEKIKNKLSRFSYALLQLKLSTDKKTALAAYYAYAHSWISYGIILWGNSTDANDIFILQKKCVRIIANIGGMDTCRPHFSKMNILTLTSIYILEMCKFIKRNPNIFDASLCSRLYDSRANNKNKYKLPNSRLHLHSTSPYVTALKIHNNLPNDLRMEENSDAFMKKIKKILQKKCYYTLTEYFNDKNFTL